MKNLKLGLVALCGILLTFSACKKDGSGPSGGNSFVVDGKSYITDVGFTFESYPGAAEEKTELLITKAVTSNTAKDNNLVYFDFYTTPLPVTGTYTYKSKDDESFNPAKNFADVALGYNLSSDDRASDANFNADRYDATGSYITISKNDETYTISYTLKFTDANKKTTTITGQYKGTI